jgi:hypothetical protein
MKALVFVVKLVEHSINEVEDTVEEINDITDVDT